MIVVAVKIVVKSGCAEAFETAVREVAPPTRLEDGCGWYEFYGSLEEPDTYLFYEEWRDEESHAAHSRTAHVQTFFAAIADLAVGSTIRAHHVPETGQL